jgi:glutamyl-tRNA reductase
VKLLLLGMNHRSAPLEVRERFAVEDPAPMLEKLVAGGEIDEAVLLSTCNRIEVVVSTRNTEAARMRLRSFFRRELAGGEELLPERILEESLYEHRDGDAMRHVLRVAAALDSMVVGEPQILGQTKDAYREAVECGASGPILDRLFQRAFATAKRVRNDTSIAERPVSVARVAVGLARRIFEDFADKCALLIGAGEMVEIALGALRESGLETIAVANRTAERAARLAVEFGATAHGLDELPSLGKALRSRRGRPMFVIDIGVPRNADPAIDEIDEVYRYDIDDLIHVANENAGERRRELARAEAIVAEEQQRFDGWFAALRAIPTIKHLRARVEEIRSAELERALGRIDLGDNQRSAVDALTRSIVNKILHTPFTRLRQQAEREDGMACLEVARMLFGLDEPEDSDATSRSDRPGRDAPDDE